MKGRKGEGKGRPGKENDERKGKENEGWERRK